MKNINNEHRNINNVNSCDRKIRNLEFTTRLIANQILFVKNDCPRCQHHKLQRGKPISYLGNSEHNGWHYIMFSNLCNINNCLNLLFEKGKLRWITIKRGNGNVKIIHFNSTLHNNV